MVEDNKMALWRPEGRVQLPAVAKTPQAIVGYAEQLSRANKRQIVAAFESTHYEMGLSFLWLRTVAALKRELETVGIELLGEMLGRANVNEEDDIEDMLTARDAIRLAEELGVVTATDAMRLRHTHELVAHFSRLDSTGEGEIEEIDEAEALASLKNCVRSVLARPKVEVARKFIEFRKALETKRFEPNDENMTMLLASPYFFLKLTVNILMNSAKTAIGATLEHCLSNTNVILPELWSRLGEAEKWRVGYTYAEVYSDGKKTSMSGLKQALLKVRGFDFVPENLRSNTFVAAATDILKAHDGMNNFYTEVAPVNRLSRLGTSIPAPAIGACVTALLAVVLGNRYGVSWAAKAVASEMLRTLGGQRWRFYLDQVLPNDVRILNKLSCDERPGHEWRQVVGEYELAELDVKNVGVAKLIGASGSASTKQAAKRLLSKYYG